MISSNQIKIIEDVINALRLLVAAVIDFSASQDLMQWHSLMQLAYLIVTHQDGAKRLTI